MVEPNNKIEKIESKILPGRAERSEARLEMRQRLIELEDRL
jgi:hypothetical protein